MTIGYIEGRISELEGSRVALLDRIEKLENADQKTANALVEIWKAICKIQNKQNGIDYAEDHTNQSTEEFVRVVRCKDCKFYDPLDPNRPYDCLYMDSIFGDDYCSRGEKR